MATQMIKINITDLGTSQSCEVEVHDDHRISDIVQLVIEAWDLPSGHRMLTRNNEEIIPDQTVADAGLEEGDNLVLAPDPVGGAELPNNIWRNRLQNESNRIEERQFYQFDITDDGPPIKNRELSVYLKDAPAYRKVQGNSDPVVVKEHTLKITLRRGFPDEPPAVKFSTEIFHPNVYSGSNNVCIGMLTNWDTSYTIIQLIMAIDALLSNPNPDDPADPSAVELYKEHPLDPPIRPWLGGSEAPAEVPSIRIVANEPPASPQIVQSPVEPPPPRIV
jgi:ubiquitin-protein ligase